MLLSIISQTTLAIGKVIKRRGIWALNNYSKI